ncbi:MAG: response regulator [Proteobacteria bacterium]|nr:response regulator [Pseudomonadota bacterium]
MRILVVDDDKINRKFLSAMLTGVGEIDMAKNGQEAIDAVQHSLTEDKPFDVIFLDIMMPDLNGIEALQEIRKIEESEGIHLSEGAKIVMVTALADKQNVLSAFSKGCEYYLVKPVQQAKMFELLEEMGYDTSAGQ